MYSGNDNETKRMLTAYEAIDQVTSMYKEVDKEVARLEAAELFALLGGKKFDKEADAKMIQGQKRIKGFKVC